MLWLGIIILSVVVLAILIVPALRPVQHEAVEQGHDAAVYRDQLAEIDRDVERGLISGEEADTARLEIQRRLLTAVEVGTADHSTGGLGIVIPAVAVIAFIAAVLLYLDLGSPGVPDFPYADRGDLEDASTMASAAPDMEQAIAELEARLKANPDDPEGWTMLGRTYMNLERYAEAQRVFQNLYDLTGDIQARGEYAEAIILGNDAQVTPGALKIFKEVLGVDPLDPKARFYFGVAAAQQGNLDDALQIWTDLLHLSPVDAPWVDIVRQQVQRAADEIGVDPTTLKPTDVAAQLAESMGIRSAGMVSPSTPGPSQEDIDNAQQMSDDEQMEMIRSMVQRLADRLAADPNDYEGWLRLAQAYEVLGETGKAEEARRRAAEVAP